MASTSQLARPTLLLALVALVCASALWGLARYRTDAGAISPAALPAPAPGLDEDRALEDSRISLATDDPADPPSFAEPTDVEIEPATAGEIEPPPDEGSEEQWLPQNFAEKYAGRDAEQLRAALVDLQRKQHDLVQRLIVEGASVGRTRTDGPVPKNPGYSLDWVSEYPLPNRPIVVVTGTEEIPGTDEITVTLAEFYPSDEPELRALRDEEVWVSHQLDLLE